jgi:hypothetical protein
MFFDFYLRNIRSVLFYFYLTDLCPNATTQSLGSADEAARAVTIFYFFEKNFQTKGIFLKNLYLYI